MDGEEGIFRGGGNLRRLSNVEQLIVAIRESEIADRKGGFGSKLAVEYETVRFSSFQGIAMVLFGRARRVWGRERSARPKYRASGFE